MGSNCDMDPPRGTAGGQGKSPFLLCPRCGARTSPQSPPPYGLQKASLKAPEREKGRAKSPLKFSAVEKKRQRESDAAQAAATAEVAATATPPPPSSSAFTCESSRAGPEFVPETQALRDENRDLISHCCTAGLFPILDDLPDQWTVGTGHQSLLHSWPLSNPR